TAGNIAGNATSINGSAGSIDGSVRSVRTSAVSINGSATGIDGDAGSIVNVARRINTDVNLINNNLDVTIQIAKNIKGDTGNIISQALSARSNAACIDQHVLGAQGSDGQCVGTGKATAASLRPSPALRSAVRKLLAQIAGSPAAALSKPSTGTGKTLLTPPATPAAPGAKTSTTAAQTAPGGATSTGSQGTAGGSLTAPSPRAAEPPGVPVNPVQQILNQLFG
ncbi:MAG: hypothetical protein ACR2QA_06425, partial [Solirubrobacteraceae bacterium]